jgi:hypothetical protein
LLKSLAQVKPACENVYIVTTGELNPDIDDKSFDIVFEPI